MKINILPETVSSKVTYRKNGITYYADSCDQLREAALAGAIELQALARGSYPGKSLPDSMLPGIRSIGYWDASADQDWRLDWHQNEGIEITFLETGKLPFSTGDQSVHLRPGQLTITRPWQPHRVGNPCVTASRLVWIILDVCVRHPHQSWTWPNWFILSNDDLNELTIALRHSNQSIWQADVTILRCFQSICQAVQMCNDENTASKESWLRLEINHLFLLLLELFRGSKIQFDASLSETYRGVELYLQELPYRLDLTWTTEEMAERCGLGVTRFIHYCKRLTNTTPSRYLTHLRIEAATRMLKNSPRKSITNIAFDCGFSSSQYFATVFTKHHGCSPSTYRSKS